MCKLFIILHKLKCICMAIYQYFQFNNNILLAPEAAEYWELPPGWSLGFSFVESRICFCFCNSFSSASFDDCCERQGQQKNVIFHSVFKTSSFLGLDIMYLTFFLFVNDRNDQQQHKTLNTFIYIVIDNQNQCYLTWNISDKVFDPLHWLL